MKKHLFAAFLLGMISLTAAQVGINTVTPQATLDVALPDTYAPGAKAGIALPMLTGNQIVQIQEADMKAGTLVFATEPSTTSNDITAAGHWYWKDSTDKWEPLNINRPNFFYSPSIVVPTAATEPGFGAIDLYENYKNQFSAPMASSVGSVGKIYTYPSDRLEYYVTYFDPAVFTNVQISQTGKMTYEVAATADTSAPSFMNVVFVVK